METIQIPISEEIGSVNGILMKNDSCTHFLVLAHGAGAGMEHAFMQQLSQDLLDQNVATLRFNFPYMHAGKRRPDSPKVAHPSIEAAFNKGKELAKGLPVWIGGKSFGGRMASQLAAKTSLENLNGLVYFGFPLHAVGKPGTERAAHLADVNVPMLFLQGTRDGLAKVDLIQSVCDPLEMATLEIMEGADHSFKMLKRSGKTQEEMILLLASTTKLWMDKNA